MIQVVQFLYMKEQDRRYKPFLVLPFKKLNFKLVVIKEFQNLNNLGIQPYLDQLQGDLPD